MIFRTLLALLIVCNLQAATINLAWQASPPEEQVTSYNMYSVTPRGARRSASWDVVAITTEPTCSISGLVSGSHHIYAVTAVTDIGLESVKSDIYIARVP